MGHRARMFILIIAAAAVYLLGNDRIPLWDRDEPRNAQAARQMFQTGDWVVPRFLDQVRTAKPVFTYWCQATAMHVFGDNTFAARFPSAVGVTLTLIVLAFVLTRYVDRERAFWTVLILATSAIVIAWSAKTSLHDAMLLLWVTIAQMAFFALLTGNSSWRVVITLAIAIGLAGLSKGPVVLGVMGMTLLVWLISRWIHGAQTNTLERTARHAPGRSAESEANVAAPGIVVLKALIALSIIAAIVGPWCYLVEHRAPGFLFRTASHDVVRRIFEPLEQHKGPPGYYALALWGIYFPWSVLLPLTFVVAWRHRSEARIRFALCATIGPWVMFECVQTKLPHYMLPIFPPLAFLTADAIVRCLNREHDDLTTKGTRGAMVTWSVIVVAIALSPFALKQIRLPLFAYVVVPLVGVVYAGLASMFFLRQQTRRGLIAMGVGMLVLMAVMLGLILPQTASLRLSIDIAAVLKEHGGDAASTKAGEVQMLQYKEPSLAFYQGGTIREQPKNDFLATHPSTEWPRFVVVREDVWKRMPESVTSQLEILGEPRGLDLADAGRTWSVIVAKKR